jgi:hypothetical protein
MVWRKISGLSYCTYGAICIATIAVLFLSSNSQASPFRFSGEWGYDQTDKQGQQEFYTQTYGATFNRQVNQAISYNGDVRYSSSWREESTKQEVLTPSLSMMLVNDFFQVGLSGSAIERMEEGNTDQSDRYWESRFFSKWRQRFVPQMRFSFGQRIELDDVVPKTLDTETTNGNANVDWEVGFGKITYNYRWQDRNNDVALTEDKSSGHFAKFDTSRSFLANRLQVNFSQTYSEDDFEYISKSLTNQFVPLTINQAWESDDSSPLNDTDYPLLSAPALSDGNTTAFTINSGDYQNIAVEVDLSFFPKVDKIYVYTDIDITTPIANQFQWDLYSNAGPFVNLNWNLLATNLTYVYNNTERRFEITIPGLQSNLIKLVSTSTPPLTNVVITEVEAFYEFSTPGVAFSIENKTQTNKTDFGLNYSFAENLKASYSLFYETRELSNDVTTDQSSHAGSLNWKPSIYFDSRLRASLTDRDDGNGAESSGRSYSLDVSSPPLPTVDLNYGIVRTESYTGDTKNSTSHGYHINSAAQLYEDLSSSLDFNYSTFTRETTGDETKTFDSRLQVTSRFNPQLAVNLSGSYNNSKSQTTTETVSSDLTINWRVSDQLLVQATGSQRWLEETPDQTGGNMKVVLALTPKCQIDLNYNVVESGDTRQDAAANLRWNINKLLSAQFNSGYRLSNDVEDWNIGVRVTAALGGH